VITPETWSHPFPPPTPFDIGEEVEFIDKMCAEGRIVAVGECGLDWHYLTDPACLAEQERVLRALIEGTSAAPRGGHGCGIDG
jgi:Tat protein secretion system quality control protein TatD with DNase activity